MATNQKFVYTVSGINLSEEQKGTIAREIGAAVTRALIGAAPQSLRSNALNICKIHGGRWIPVDEVAKQNVGEVVAASEG